MAKKTTPLELLPGEGDELLIRNDRGQIAHIPDGLVELESLIKSGLSDGFLVDRYGNAIEATVEQLEALL